MTWSARSFSILLVLSAFTAAQEPAPAEDAKPISDNSFLIEEAYNQEYGVVQHISTFSRSYTGSGWQVSFTQEWPFDPAPKHQLSYTVPIGSDGGNGAGIGDMLLNYRYQVVANDRAAFAPRVSLLVPSGDVKTGHGNGGTGVQFNLPLSVTAAPKLVTHWNLGGTLVPNGKDAAGNQAALHGYNAGQSLVFLAHPRFNLMLETYFDSQERVVGAGETQRENTFLVSPGFRWSHDLDNGLQVVPGIAFPIGVGPSRGQNGFILYLSLEHPFRNLKK